MEIKYWVPRIRVVLGIDPGLNITGWGCIIHYFDYFTYENRQLYISCGFYKNKGKDLTKKLIFLNKFCKKLIQEINPDLVAIEEIFISSNRKTSMILSYARAVIIICTEKKKLFHIPNLKLKKIIGGSYKSNKKEIGNNVNYWMRSELIWATEDVSDALGVAICASILY